MNRNVMVMKQPLVTIGLPVYNNRHTILDAIKSVLCQSYSNWELIVVDDGSTDGTLDLIKNITESRIRYIRDGENRGLAWRLNQIAKAANGNYLARMDADDLLHPERIERQVRYLQEHPDVDVLGSGMYSLGVNDQIVGMRYANNIPTTVKGVLLRGCLLHPTVIARTEWFIRNPYDVRLRRSQDTELWCRTVDSSVFASLHEPLYFYREVGAMSGNEYFRKYVINQRVRRELLKRYGSHHLRPSERLHEHVWSYIKVAMYWFLTGIGLHALLTDRRGNVLPAEEAAAAHQILEQIRAHELPV